MITKISMFLLINKLHQPIAILESVPPVIDQSSGNPIEILESNVIPQKSLRRAILYKVNLKTNNVKVKNTVK